MWHMNKWWSLKHTVSPDHRIRSHSFKNKNWIEGRERGKETNTILLQVLLTWANTGDLNKGVGILMHMPLLEHSSPHFFGR